MQVALEDSLFLSEEEIKQMASVLTDVLIHSSFTRVEYAPAFTELEAIERVDLEVLSSAVAGVADPLGQLRAWLIEVLNAIAAFIISSLETFVKAYVIPAIDAVVPGIQVFINTVVLPAITGIKDFISMYVLPAISGVITTISETIHTTVLPAISGVMTGIVDYLSKTVVPAISGVITSITGFITTNVIPFILEIIPSITGFITTTALPAIFRTITDIINFITTTVIPAIAGVLDRVVGFIRAYVIPAIFGVLSRIIEFMTATVVPAITRVFSGVIGFITTTVIPAITGAFGRVISFISANVIPTILRMATSIMAFMTTGVVPPILNIVPSLSGFITATVIPAVVAIPPQTAGLTSQAIAPRIDQLLIELRRATALILEAITKVPQIIIGAIGPTLDRVAEGFGEFAKVVRGFVNAMFRLPEWFERNLVTPFLTGVVRPLAENVAIALRVMGEAVWRGLTWVWDTLAGWFKSASEILLGAVKGIMEWLNEALFGFLKFLHELTIKIGGPIGDFFRSLYAKIEEESGKVFSAFLAPMHMGIVKELGMGSPEFLTLEKLQTMYLTSTTIMAGAFFLPLWGQLPIRLITWVAGPLTRWLSEQEWRIRMSLRPIGVGLQTEFNLAKALGASIHTYLRQLRRWLEHLGAGYAYGIAIWLTQPMTRVLNYPVRNYIPIMLPEVPTIIEFTRRTVDYKYTYGVGGELTAIEPTSFYKDRLDLARYYTALFGYSDENLRWFFSYETKDFVKFLDRFNRIKNFPISITHELPTPSDMARMMVRDMFGPIGISITVDGREFTHPLDSFERAICMRGMTKDIAYMYYLLHFKYPPPEKLWTFTIRAVSGLLWVEPPTTEMEVFKKEADRIGAYTPVAPIKLNFRGDVVLPAFRRYMKWHDYALFAWIRDMPSDNLINIDVLADIPTKIDQRWMVKWALYETMAGKGITVTSPIKDFRVKMVEDAPKSQIMMDLSTFCKTLQATGLHPDWVPLTAVAEAINALTEERTLLRTGFLSLFKEGFWDVTALEKLLAGFVMASFKVSYVKNIEGSNAEAVWETAPKWINQPVMFLPAERKLLELRALMDRSLDILRDIQRDISRAYSEFIVWDYNEYKSRLTEVIDRINVFFASDYKSITGVELPTNLKLKFVEEYYKPYVEALRIWRDVYTIRRVRYWTMRWLGWIMYRVATGVVKKEDVIELAKYVGDEAKLTDKERTFIQGVLERMLGIAQREYIPTPTMLATLSEYIVIWPELIKQAFDERLVPLKWRQIWERYIEIRPVADDIKALLTTYRRALVRFTIPEETRKLVEGYAQKIGFGKEEWKVLELRAELEESILESREYVPPLSTLATFSEYMVIPPDMIEDVFKARRVPEVWQAFWRDYIAIRPLVDDVRGLLTAYRRALVYVAIPEDIMKKVQAYADRIRFTKDEWDILALRAGLEELVIEARESRREYIPTPMMLASMAEIVPEARAFFDDVVRARRIPPEWAGVWAKYIDYRPMISEVRRMVSRVEDLYTYFVVSEEVYREVLDKITFLGYTDEEIELMLASSRYERFLRAWRELIGDPDKMIRLSEYSPIAREFALQQLNKMIDALPIADETKRLLKEMWHQYIRVRPVMDEVRRYITELISDFVEGIITEAEFVSELEELKKWGLDDYEIMFYKSLAGLRKARYLARMRRGG